MANTNADRVFNVKNRSASVVVYRIPEEGIRREFAPGEVKKLSFNELEKLTYQAGGRELMANFLQIQEDIVNDRLNIPRENEYYMSEEQIIELLKSGSEEAFEDCLDFAPIGVLDLVKKFAVSLPLTDTIKIRILRDKTGFDVEKALANMDRDKASEKTEPTQKPVTKGRRVNTNYKVISKAVPQ